MRRPFACSIATVFLAACHPLSPGAEALVGANAMAPVAPRFDIDRVRLSGEGGGGGLTVDSDARRLYVTHAAAVHVLDLTSLAPLFKVEGLHAAHGVALDPVRGHGFVSDGSLNGVVMFDLADGKAITTIPAGKNPDSIVHDTASGLVFVANRASSDLSVIDPAKARVIRTIRLPNAPGSSQADGQGRLWVTLSRGDAIAEIDSRTMSVRRIFRLAGCEKPGPLAFDPSNRLLFAGCTGNAALAMVDADSGRVVATARTEGEPGDIAFDDAKDRLFVASRKGRWTIIDQIDRTRYAQDQILAVDDGAGTVSVDPRTHRAFSSAGGLAGSSTGRFRLIAISEK